MGERSRKWSQNWTLNCSTGYGQTLRTSLVLLKMVFAQPVKRIAILAYIRTPDHPLHAGCAVTVRAFIQDELVKNRIKLEIGCDFMRTEHVQVSFRFPVRTGEPDKNGNIYTKEAIAEACVGAGGQPIIQRDERGEEIPVGVANKVWFEDGHINVEGMAWFGGTCEKVKFDDLNRISDMTITSFSICN